MNETITQNTIECHLVNGVGGDPCVYLRSLHSGEACLFDLGTLTSLSHKQLLKVTTVMISHTHLDHFIGFDTLIRATFSHKKELCFCGPKGVATQIQHKMRGFTWNLIDDDQIRYVVHEIDKEGCTQSFSLGNIDGFELHKRGRKDSFLSSSTCPLPMAPQSFITDATKEARIEGVCLDHGIDSVAYLYQGGLRFVFKTDEAARLNLRPGPWITELQQYISANQYSELISVDGEYWQTGELAAEVLKYSTPRLVGYVTDCLFSWNNIGRIKGLMDHVEVLVCETNYDCDTRDKATQNKHLTSKQVALIAAYLKAGKLVNFHISKIYHEDYNAVITQSQDFFATFSKMDEVAVKEEIEQELKLVSGIKS